MERKSNTYILAKFDISGIQQYIFATNRLRENVGASCQVTKILEEYLPESITEASVSGQKYVIEWKKEDKLRILKDESIRIEIIYIGGGNAMVLFGDREGYVSVCQTLARKVAEKCQGIYLAAAYIETELQCFKDDAKKLTLKMDENKANMIRQPIYSPFPVTEQDNSNHQPITRCICENNEKSEGTYTVENMTEMRYQKCIAYKSENHQDQKLYPLIDGKVEYVYPVEVNDLCRKSGEDSYIAVVHIDGNGMGQQIQDILYTYGKYAKAVPMLRKKSKEISDIFKNTYQEVLLKLWEQEQFRGTDNNGKVVFPLRPIVLDGDDFTFLCTADLAVPLTAGFLNALMKNQKKRTDKITACAGIAYVHSHFPFYEAYRIAEESCSRAKKKWYGEKREKKDGQEKCLLDFSLLKGSEVGGTRKHEEWQIRPYFVTAENKDTGPDSLIRLYKIMKQMEDKWPSNRLHKIYRAILEGKDRMKLLEKEFASRDYIIKELTQGENWEASPLFDALELRGLCNLKLLADYLNVQE